MTIAERLAGTPISWGVCEVPGWGWQLDSATVLLQMQELGLVATEFGPDGFLPDDPQGKAKTLADRGLSAVGGFVPAVLHDPAVDPVRAIHKALAGFKASGASTLVLAAATGTQGYDARPGLDDDGWQVLLGNLDRLALFAGRIRHTHLKDVDADLAKRVRAGEVTYTEAVRGGMYRPLGQGDVGIASIVGSLERAGFDGWYVLEQDTILAGPHQVNSVPARDQEPMADVRASIDHLVEIAGSLS